MAERQRLAVQNLVIHAGTTPLVQEVSLEVEAGEIVALVGGSGSGKTMTARACLGLVVPRPGVVGGGIAVTVGETTLRPYSAETPRERQRLFDRIRGGVVGYLPQQANGSLDPLWRIGRQVEEVISLRETPTEKGVFDWLRMAGFPRPEGVARLYPHELSGGMAQRACIALALARGSSFLLADEPTTGLDPTVQQAILDEVRNLRSHGIGVLFITHDLRIIPGLADRVVVMHQGRVAETLGASDLEAACSAPARALLAATARVAGGLL